MYSFSLKLKCNVRYASSLPLLDAHQLCNTELTVKILLMTSRTIHQVKKQ